MSDYIESTPEQTESFCPACYPTRDQSTDHMLIIQWCSNHEPDRAGADDTQIIAQYFLSGSGDCEGYTNKRWCDALHRGKWTALALVFLLAGCATPPPPTLICEPYVLEGWRVNVCVDHKTWYEQILPNTGPGPYEEKRMPRPKEGA